MAFQFTSSFYCNFIMQTTYQLNHILTQKQRSDQQQRSKTVKKKFILKPIKQKLVSPQPHIWIKHILNIHDSFFINEQTLKFPEQAEETVLKTTFYFKKISKLQLNNKFITLHLKKIDQNLMPKQYFIERFKSFGDQYFYDLANNIEFISNTFNKINQKLKQTNLQKLLQNQQKSNAILEKTINQYSQRQSVFFCFFFQHTTQGHQLDKFIISRSCFQQLGYDVEKIVIDYIAHKNINVQIFSSYFYKQCTADMVALATRALKKLLADQPISPQEIKCQTSKQFKQLKQIESSNESGFSKEIQCTIKYHKPFSTISMFQYQNINILNFNSCYFKQSISSRILQRVIKQHQMIKNYGNFSANFTINQNHSNICIFATEK